MLSKEQIIVLHTTKHSDTGLVVNGYSNQYGMGAYYYYASKKNAGAALLTPLNILDSVVFYRHSPGIGTGLPLLKEIVPAVSLRTIKTDLNKTSIAIFMCELLSRTIREVEANTNLFTFIATSIELLEAMDEGIENFHLFFTANLCRSMGYMPQDNYSATCPHFNYALGEYVAYFNRDACFPPEYSKLLNSILTTPINELKSIECNGKTRGEFLQKMIEYLEYHTQSRLNLKSIAILKEVFNNN